MRITFAAALVMQAIGAGHCHGFDIVEVTGYPTGTVYPALRRLERDRLVRSQWEPDRAAAREGRPARRYYELTASGVKALDTALQVIRRLDAASRLNPGRA